MSDQVKLLLAAIAALGIGCNEMQPPPDPYGHDRVTFCVWNTDGLEVARIRARFIRTSEGTDDLCVYFRDRPDGADVTFLAGALCYETARQTLIVGVCPPPPSEVLP